MSDRHGKPPLAVVTDENGQVDAEASMGLYADMDAWLEQEPDDEPA